MVMSVTSGEPLAVNSALNADGSIFQSLKELIRNLGNASNSKMAELFGGVVSSVI